MVSIKAVKVFETFNGKFFKDYKKAESHVETLLYDRVINPALKERLKGNYSVRQSIPLMDVILENKNDIKFYLTALTLDED